MNVLGINGFVSYASLFMAKSSHKVVQGRGGNADIAVEEARGFVQQIAHAQRLARERRIHADHAGQPRQIVQRAAIRNPADA